MEMPLEAFLREMHGATSAPRPAPRDTAPRDTAPRDTAPRDKASDDAARDGISRQWRPTPGDLEPPF